MLARMGRVALVTTALLIKLVTCVSHGQETGISVLPESETVQRIRAALDKPVSDELKPEERQGPLDAIVKRISALHQIPIDFDKKSMGDAGVQSDIAVVMTTAKIPLKSALKLVLRPNELTTIFRDERLVITTKAAAEDIALNGVTRVYEIGDLCPKIRMTQQNRFQRDTLEWDTETLVRLICNAVVPPGWSDRGGAGAARIGIINGVPVLVVSQTQEIQEKVPEFLRTLRAARACQMKPDPRYEKEIGGVPVSLGTSTPFSWRKQFDESHDFNPVAKLELQDLPKYFGTLVKLPIELDTKALGDAGVPLDAALHVTEGRFSLAAAFTACLRPHELTWLVQDGVIQITTRAAACDVALNGEVRVYPVADLVGYEWSPATSEKYPDYDSLIQLIYGNVSPTCWSDVGGAPSDVQPFEGCLVVNQVHSIHEEISTLLTALRKARLASKPVAQPQAPQGLQVRVFTIPGMADQPASHTPPTQDIVPKNVRSQLGGGSANSARTMTQAIQMAKELVETIPQVIAVKSWKGAGGEGTIHAVGNHLVVRQEMAVIDEIAEFLSALHEQPGHVGAGFF